MTTAPGWRLVITKTAKGHLAGITDQRIQQNIAGTLRRLRQDPDKQGKPLTGDLADYRSLRVVGQRYRVVYKVEQDRMVVYVVTIGIRKQGSIMDVYEIARNLLHTRP